MDSMTEKVPRTTLALSHCVEVEQENPFNSFSLIKLNSIRILICKEKLFVVCFF